MNALLNYLPGWLGLVAAVLGVLFLFLQIVEKVQTIFGRSPRTKNEASGSGEVISPKCSAASDMAARKKKTSPANEHETSGNVRWSRLWRLKWRCLHLLFIVLIGMILWSSYFSESDPAVRAVWFVGMLIWLVWLEVFDPYKYG